MSLFGILGKPDIETLIAKKKVSSLIRAASYDDSSDPDSKTIQERAIEALGDLRASEAVLALVSKLNLDDQEMTQLVCCALEQIGDATALTGLLSFVERMKRDRRVPKEHKEIHAVVLETLTLVAIKNPKKTFELLSLQLVNSYKLEDRTIDEVATALACCGADAVGLALVVLKESRLNQSAFVDKNELRAARVAIGTLGHSGHVDGVQPLLRYLEHANFHELHRDILAALDLIQGLRDA